MFLGLLLSCAEWQIVESGLLDEWERFADVDRWSGSNGKDRGGQL